MDGSTVGVMISLASVCYGNSQVTKLFSTPGLPTNLGVGQSWLFTAFSIRFLTRRSLKSWWVYLAPREVTVSNF